MTIANHNESKHFLQALLGLVVAAIAVVAGFNYFVDPYGIFGRSEFLGRPLVRPELGTHGRLFKAAEIMRLHPQAIFLGSSRAATGLAPHHPGLSADTYNLAIDGSDMHEVLAYFQHALANQPNLRLVIFGVDPEMFANGSPKSDFDEARIGARRLTIKDMANSLISIDALKASLETLYANFFHKAIPYYHENGQRTELAWLQKPFAERWAPPTDQVVEFPYSDTKIEEFRTLVDTCRRHKIQLLLFFSPAHVSYNERRWGGINKKILAHIKSALVAIAPIYDFSGVNSVTVEKPSPTMKYYIDASHYNERTGNIILDKLLGLPNASAPADFGKLMQPPEQVAKDHS